MTTLVRETDGRFKKVSFSVTLTFQTLGEGGNKVYIASSKAFFQTKHDSVRLVLILVPSSLLVHRINTQSNFLHSVFGFAPGILAWILLTHKQKDMTTAHKGHENHRFILNY